MTITFAPKIGSPVSLLPDRIIHEWNPWEDVQIKTTIIPLIGSHLRIHEINLAPFLSRWVFITERGNCHH